MRRHPGTYDLAQYLPWIDVTHLPGVESGERPATAWWQDETMVALMGLKVLGVNLAEVKYFRVAAPKFSSRGLGDFQAKQIGPEAVEMLTSQGMISSDANAITVQLDTPADSAAHRFFVQREFVEVGREELYTPGKIEVIMQKQVELR